jgi:ADP-ribose pyrophosphatase YjhB (NUDIX family)
MTCIVSRNINYTKYNKEKDSLYPKSNYNFRNKRSGGIIIDTKNNKILLVLNRESVINNNAKWGLPKGHLKTGEKYEQCATREIEEETGIKVDINPRKFKKINDTIYFIITLDSTLYLPNPKDKKEILAAKWIDLDVINCMSCNRGLRRFYQIKDTIMNKLYLH